jgi:predicted esterase
VREHFTTIKKTARYVTLGEPKTAGSVWFLCHGYGQLASRFIHYCSVLDDGATYLVAPEAMSRFYLEPAMKLHGPDSKVGASWMTREDRLNEISDYVRYLDQVYDESTRRIGNRPFKTVALGFSQGTATVSRWIEGGHARVDRLILWGGHVPKDVDLDGAISQTKLTLVLGDQDEFASRERIEAAESRLHRHGIDYEIVRFEGGHHLNQHVLKALAEETGKVS